MKARRGKALLERLRCTSCHIADWIIRPAGERDHLPGMPGDRRFFHLEVVHYPDSDQLRGRLIDLTRTIDFGGKLARHIPRRGGFVVREIYTDLLHHDLGPRFYEHHRIDGELFELTRYRTPPLWGVGSTAPYGHDGRSLTLDEVIRRHGGEADSQRRPTQKAPKSIVELYFRSWNLWFSTNPISFRPTWMATGASRRSTTSAVSQPVQNVSSPNCSSKLPHVIEAGPTVQTGIGSSHTSYLTETRPTG